jgi:hypothetical protein
VAWSVRAFDGVARPDPERVALRVGRGLRDGAIVLLHDSAERDDFEPSSIEALPEILTLIEQKGLRTLRVDELLAADESEPVRPVVSERKRDEARHAEGDEQRQQPEGDREQHLRDV